VQPEPKAEPVIDLVWEWSPKKNFWSRHLIKQKLSYFTYWRSGVLDIFCMEL